PKWSPTIEHCPDFYARRASKLKPHEKHFAKVTSNESSRVICGRLSHLDRQPRGRPEPRSRPPAEVEATAEEGRRRFCQPEAAPDRRRARQRPDAAQRGRAHGRQPVG